MGFGGWVRVPFVEERAGPWPRMGYTKSKTWLVVGFAFAACRSHVEGWAELHSAWGTAE